VDTGDFANKSLNRLIGLAAFRNQKRMRKDDGGGCDDPQNVK